MASIDQQFVEFIVKSLVGKPDAVKVERRIDEKGVLLELTVDPEDLGRVIGKRGATAQSIRSLLRALGTKNDARYNLKIVDNGVYGNSNDSHSSQKPVSDDEEKSEPTKEKSEDNDDVKVTEDTAEEPADESGDEEDKSSKNHSSVVSKTRKELEELDDLDV